MKSPLFLLTRTYALSSILFLLLISPIHAPAQGQNNDRALKLPSSEPVRTLPGSAKRYALVIGVDQYADTQITTLGGASNDARTLANALVQYAGFPRDQVTLLASDQPAERLPTRGNILRRLSNMAAVVPPDVLPPRVSQAFLPLPATPSCQAPTAAGPGHDPIAARGAPSPISTLERALPRA